VQRLSTDVTGKAQKYSRIGPREFVQVGFDDDELTIEKIKDACLKHFAPQTGSNVVCDVLAGEQGPSCSHIKQVPDLKLIYVRFFDPEIASAKLVDDEDDEILFTAGNLSKEAISTFIKEHVCHYYCDQLGLNSP